MRKGVVGVRVAALWALSWLGAMSWAGPASAQEPNVRAYLTPGSTVAPGGSFTLNVEVSGTQDVQRDIQLPDLASFAQFLSSSSQSSVQMVNGQTSVSITLQYRYQALAEGTHDIPSFEVQAGGRNVSTEPLQITVSPDAAPARSESSPVGPDDLFITAEP
ncbi:MAG: BatD family protein, partial [Gemmatimonadetes bacterium]|nr:BatD family protein [Gemmatimonadota bacterium]